jgi:hypothetical protein
MVCRWVRDRLVICEATGRVPRSKHEIVRNCLRRRGYKVPE